VAAATTVLASDAEAPKGALPTDGNAASERVESVQRTAPQRPRSLATVIAILAVVTIGLGALALRRVGAAPSAGAPPGAAGGAGPTTVLDLPLPTAAKPEALAAYRRGLQSTIDTDMKDAMAAMTEAVTLDPGFAAAHLRLARLMLFGGGTTARAKEVYLAAVRLRAALDERDQALLKAYAPMLGPGNAEGSGDTLRRLQLLQERYPTDAEIALEVCILGPSLPSEQRLAACRSATELDPKYAVAWQNLGQEYGRQGRLDDALAALQHCVALVPSAGICGALLSLSESMRGDCAAAEGYAVRAGVPMERALALHALGRPEDVVLAVVSSDWKSSPLDEVVWRTALDLTYGRFPAAEERLRKLAPALAAERALEPHSLLASVQADLMVETGRDAEADAIANDYLSHADVWVPMALWKMMQEEATPAMLATRLHAKTLDDQEWRRRAAAWRDVVAKDAGKAGRHITWGRAFGRAAETPAQATIALAEPDAELPPLPFIGVWFGLDAEVGHTMLLAGRVDDALVRLQREAKACRGLFHPFTHVRARLWLGQALEAKGDTAGACDAYGFVVERWGAAKPKSVTAEAAKKRISALHCPQR
jgi:serine/threonine-protein kinase